MPASILDGNKIAAEIRAEAAAEVRAMTAAGARPGLAVILVGTLYVAVRSTPSFGVVFGPVDLVLA